MNTKRLWSLLALALVIVMALALFACTPNDSHESGSETTSEESQSPSQSESSSDESGESSVTESGSESESKNEDSSESGECKHTDVYYEDLGDGSKCKKVCANCKETLSTAKHSKGDPDPEDNCNIRCKKCNYLMQENKHTKGSPDPDDNCNVKCTKCSKILLAAKHAGPDEDATWTVDPADPQREYAGCSNCGSKMYRGATTTMEGLTIFAPDFLAADDGECIRNTRFTYTVETDENGLTFLRVVAKTTSDGLSEITITLNDGKSNGTGDNGNLLGVGNYVAALVRHESAEDEGFDFWINKAGRVNAGVAGESSYAKCLTKTLECDGNWRLLIFDFSQCDYIDTENGVGWVRFDVNNPENESIIDIAYIGFFSSEEAITTYYKSYVDAYIGSDGCTHIPDNNKVASSTTPGYIVMHCKACGSELNPAQCEHNDLSKLSNITAVNSTGIVSFRADCAVCGLEGAELLSLNSDKNKTYTAAELAEIAHNQASANLENNGGYGRYNVTLVNNDASVNNMPYVKFTAKIAAECCLLLNNGATNLDGQYLGKYVAILYRKPEGTVSPAMQFLYTKNGSTTPDGHVSGLSETVNDGEWHLAIIDVTHNTAVNIEDGIGWTRLDILDPRTNLQIAAGDEIDIAFVSFFDSKEAADEYFAEYLKAYLGLENCTHRFEGKWEGTGTRNEMKNVCVVCGESVVLPCTHESDGNWKKHDVAGQIKSKCAICTATIVKVCEHESDGNWTPTGNEFEFKSTCTVCDCDVIFVCNHRENSIEFTDNAGEFHLVCTFCKYDRVSTDTTADGLKLFGPAALGNAGFDYTSNINGKYTATVLSDEANKNMPFVRFQLVESTPRETFLWINEKGEPKIENVGAYFMIIYRLSANCPTGVEVFVSANDADMKGTNGKKVTLVADGEWHYAIFDFTNVKDWNGTEAIEQLRIDLFNEANVPADEYFDIATAGFFSSKNSAITHYEMVARKYAIASSDFYAHFDASRCTLDGSTTYAIKLSGKGNVAMTADLTGKTLQSVNSLTVGGWCLAPSGIQSVNYRVVEADGTKSDLKKLCDAANCSQTMADIAANAGCSFGENSGKGGNFQGFRTIDLTGYEGDIVTVQIVIVNNDGQEAVIGILNNVSVPSAQ